MARCTHLINCLNGLLKKLVMHSLVFLRNQVGMWRLGMEQIDQQLSQLLKTSAAHAEQIKLLKRQLNENATIAQELLKERQLSDAMFLFLDERGLYQEFNDFINELPLREVN